MKTEIAVPDDNERVDTGEGMIDIPHDLMKKTTNKAGIEMWKYRYWKIKAQDGVFLVTIPEEIERITNAINSKDVFLVKIANALINKHSITSIKEEIGYKRIEQ